MKPQLKLAASTAYRIEKGIPLGRNLRGEIIYPFADMAPRDSFLVPTATEAEYKRISNSLHRQVRMFNKLFDKDCQFTVRRVDGGARCWRVK